jgi:antitoxin component YwqK of YwqJK toxin-antitoxin module
MIQIKISSDILQYILNPYLDFRTDIPIIEYAINNLQPNCETFKFLQKPHLLFKSVRAQNHLDQEVLTNYTYLDKILLITEDILTDTNQRIIYSDYSDKNSYKHTHYYPNGNKSGESYYSKDGILHGKRTLWYTNGAIQSEYYYQYGEKVKIIKYDRFGNFVNEWIK